MKAPNNRWWLATLLALGACGEDFEQASTVSDVRILAVQGSPTFAAPGEKVDVRALVADPRGRPLSIAWTTCLLPRSSVVNGCLSKIAEDARAGRPPVITKGDGLVDYQLTIPADALANVPREAQANAVVGVVTVACPGTIDFGDAATWTDTELPIRCLGPTGAPLPADGFVVSVKRISIRTVDRNANPPISSVTWQGADWPETETKTLTACTNEPVSYADCKGGDEVDVSVVAPSSAAETGEDEFGTPFEEQVIAQYYATGGTFEFDVKKIASPKTTFAARASAKGTTQTMWFVVRDDRGGVSFTTRKVDVR